MLKSNVQLDGQKEFEVFSFEPIDKPKDQD